MKEKKKKKKNKYFQETKHLETQGVIMQKKNVSVLLKSA